MRLPSFIYVYVFVSVCVRRNMVIFDKSFVSTDYFVLLIKEFKNLFLGKSKQNN